MMNRKTMLNGSFFLLLAWTLYEAARLLWPSAGALFVAAVLAIVFYPVHQWLSRRISNRTICAILSEVLVFTFFFMPVGVLVWAAIAQSDTVIPIAKPAVESLVRWTQSAPRDILLKLSVNFPWLADQLNQPSAAIQSHFDRFTQQSIASIAQLGSATARFTVQWVGYLLLAVVALFFFFRDGTSLLSEMNRLLPLRADLKIRLEDEIGRMMIGVVRGSILTSLAQGIAATLGFLMLQTPSAFLLGFISLLISVIPVVGTALVWGPVSVYYFWSGAYGKGIFLVLWGLLVTGSIDNFLRPWLIGNKQDISFFWLFFSIVGGLQVFGIFGLFVGPLIMTVLMILIDIYKQLFLPKNVDILVESDAE
jgi:predicted PurR-regulated permease PerM